MNAKNNRARGDKSYLVGSRSRQTLDDIEIDLQTLLSSATERPKFLDVNTFDSSFQNHAVVL